MIKNIIIGIPAYNEEKNIRQLLESLLKQNSKFFRIKKIVVAIDGSTDNTEYEVKKVKDHRIQIITGKQRKGKAIRLNQMYSKLKDDIFVQFDADIKILDKNLINKLVAPFITNPKNAVVFGKQEPLPPNSFIGKLASFGFYSWEKAKLLSRKNIERYNCFGQITAFSREFLKDYRIPEEVYVTEDTYSFYFAKQQGYRTFFQEKATIFFKLPETIKDYTHQMSRYISTNSDMALLFGKKLTSKYETLSTANKIQGLFNNLKLSNIHIGISYLILQIITKIQNSLSKQKIEWITITSSK